MTQLGGEIWKIHENMTPLTLMCGTWLYDTWWKRFRGFLKTGKWPKKQYIEGLLDKCKSDPDFARINWFEEPE